MENVIRTAVTDVLSELGIDPVDFAVEHPGDLSHGDYAVNVAMVAAKAAGQNPRELAEAIIGKLEGQIEYVEKIEVAGPGFINFHLTRDFFIQELIRATEAGDAWGKSTEWEGKKVIVEYTDPNPFKEFHIGHLFTNSVGEAISRLFAFSGADVKRANWQGDVGLHVASAIWGMQRLGLTADSNFTAADLGKAYATGATANKEDETAKAEIKVLNKAIYERSDEAVNALYDAGRSVSLAYFETMYEKLGTKFDGYFFEGEAAGLATELVNSHPDVFTESDGAMVFAGEEYDLHTRVFLNSEGLPTYEAKELALAEMKNRHFDGYDYSVIVTANEITEYFKVLLKAMSFVHPDLAEKTEHIGHGTVRLKSGKMSSRTGEVITAQSFINDIAAAAQTKMEENGTTADPRLSEQIALAAIKYATLHSNILQDSVFDKEKALSFEGDSGPYLQYTYARIQSVAEKASTNNVTPNTHTAPEQAYEVEKVLYQFPEVVERSLAERAPHVVTGYLTELAGAFNTFYAKEKIADPDDEFAPYKLALAQAVGQTLKNGLWILGIKTPERM